MQRITLPQIAAIVIVIVVLATARQWPWQLQALAVAAAALGFGAMAWREAGGRLPWLPQRPRVTYWRGRPVPVDDRVARLRLTRSTLVYAGLALCCLLALLALAWRLLS